MTHAAEDVLKAVMARSPADRGEVLDALIVHEDASPVRLSDEWLTEIRRRSAEYDSGSVTGISWHDVRDRANREILGGE